MVLEAGERQLAATYHLGGSQPDLRYDFARKVAQIFDLDLSLIMPSDGGYEMGC